MFFRVFILFVSLFINQALGAITNPPDVDAVKKVAETYCQADFNGVPDIRSNLAKFSTKRARMEKKRDPELQGMVIAFEADQILIVDSYQLQNVAVDGNRAVVTVAYDRLAKTSGSGLPGRKIIPDHVKLEIVEIHLVLNKGRWLILDPPLPRISIKALIQYYEDYAARMERWIHTERASDPQKHNYEEIIDDLKILKNLPLQTS